MATLIDSYGELKNFIQLYLLQDDVVAQIPIFIQLFEARAQREIVVRQMQAISGPTAIPTTGILPLPADYVELRSHVVNKVTPRYLPPNLFIERAANDTGGYPRSYTIVGSEMHFSPKPDDPTLYEHTMYYAQKIPALSDTNTSNWLLLDAPDLYIYGSLLESAPYVMDDARIQTWVQLYERALHSLVAVDTRSRFRPNAAMSAGPRYEGSKTY
jgi:hypothetical protein